MIRSKFVIVLLLIALGFSCKSTKQLPETVSIENIGKIKSDVETLSADEMEGREIGTQGELMAAQFLSDRMKEMGLQPKGVKGYYQFFEKKRSINPHEEVTAGSPVIKGRNVVGYLDNSAKLTVVIGAHYDHLGYGTNGIGSLYAGKEPAIHNGADDNASGVSCMLRIAEILAKGELKDYNYLFVGFSGEEQGLWGSNFFAKNPTVSKEEITYMINMDMVGRLGEERKLLNYGSGTSPQWAHVMPSKRSHSFHIIDDPSGMGPTDHTSFYLENIPVLSFFTGQHSDYHKPSDDAHLINYKGISDISNYIVRVISNTQGMDKFEFTKTKDASQEKMDFKVTLGVMPDYLYDGKGMKMDGVKEDRPAGNAGMIKGDVVIKMGDLEIADMMGYMKALGQFEPGQTVPVVIMRDGEKIEKQVTF